MLLYHSRKTAPEKTNLQVVYSVGLFFLGRRRSLNTFGGGIRTILQRHIFSQPPTTGPSPKLCKDSLPGPSSAHFFVFGIRIFTWLPSITHYTSVPSHTEFRYTLPFGYSSGKGSCTWPHSIVSSSEQVLVSLPDPPWAPLLPSCWFPLGSFPQVLSWTFPLGAFTAASSPRAIHSSPVLPSSQGLWSVPWPCGHLPCPGLQLPFLVVVSPALSLASSDLVLPA